MKNKILEDILVYIISPILVFGLEDFNKIKYLIIGLCFIIALYTINGKKRDGRINLTGLIFSIIYIAFFSFKQNIQPEFERYVMDTYFLITCTILMIILNLLDRNIIKQIYRDCLRSKGWSSLSVWNFFKKSKTPSYLKKIESVVIVHILALVFIRVYSIATYGYQNFKTTADLEILISVLFIIGEIYILSKIISLSNLSKNDEKKEKNNIEHSKSNKRVINLNQYKKINK